MIEQIQDLKHFEEIKNSQKDYFLLIFYTDTSQKSIEALKNLEEFKSKNPDVSVYAVNASKVKDIHPLYNINAVPAVLLFKKGKPVDQVYGVQSSDFYERFTAQMPSKNAASKDNQNRKLHRVIVYTSTTCPWCAAAKAYLSKNHIPYTEINVSENPSAADELVRKTGHTGVPQIDIDGTFVIGFDKAKINRLLGIN
ncbi:Glutaredoxin-like protein, YruB-family [Caldanaerobius fijiensis DSM 17918]|uniref:Glutaredoxin-like protein, YruB-family n=1 Tax=Caldanaerobius fijiensis DSM 17918 TaxID=1121256 RepID=A0A1M4ZBQ1_9THEO|nr:thioredoxin family protein [Caldanaerobius fijiensis]SHF15473.1 Glutaredoxin-like protein, YruB-family [Caldanaerobius fijiensis DSM 17918]